MPRLGDESNYTLYITEDGEGIEEPMGEGCDRVVLMGPLEPRHYDRVAAKMLESGVVRLTVSGQQQQECDCRFLAIFGFVSVLHVSAEHITRLGPLDRWMPGLTSLTVEETKSRNLDLDFLPQLRHLEDLTLKRHPRFLRIAGELAGLKSLTLHSISLPSPEQMTRWSELECLTVRRGKCLDQSGLAHLATLRQLDIGQVLGIKDLSWLASLGRLESFRTHWQAHIASFPSLERLKKLRSVHCDTLTGLVDVSGLSDASSLEEADFVACSKLDPESFRPFVGHPTLRRVRAGAGSDRKNRVIQALLGSVHESPLGGQM